MGQAHRRIRRQDSLRNLRTAVTARVRSKPLAEGQHYLDLYALKRDRTRWSRAKERAEEAIQSIDKALAKVERALSAESGRAPDCAGVTKSIDFKTGARPRSRV